MSPGPANRLRRAAMAGGVVALVALALAPLAPVTDVPGVDQPHHMSTIAAWHHIDDPRYGLAEHYRAEVRPDPYFAYYAFVNYAGYLMPLRWANKLFHAASVLLMLGGFAAVLRAHGRPRVLALAALPLAWNYNMEAGFVSTIAGSGVLLYSYALMVRAEDARPWPSWRLLAGCAATGLAVYLFHFLGWLLWVPLVVLRLRWRAIPLIIPSALLFTIQADRPKMEMMELHVRWHANALGEASRFFFAYVDGGVVTALALGLLAALVVAFVLVRRDPTPDRRPLVLLLVLVVVYLVVPFAVYKPFYWSNINIRVVPVAFVVAFACVPRGTLPGWRAWAAAAPIAAVLIAYVAIVIPRLQGWERRSRDFYAVISHLPWDPDVLVLVHDAEDPLGKQLWREHGAYTSVDKGGARYVGWDRGFPVSPRNKKLDQRRKDKDPAHYRYLAARYKAKKLPKSMPGFRLIASSGQWTLWENEAKAPR